MSAKQKARALVSELYEFDQISPQSPITVTELARRASQAARGLGGRVEVEDIDYDDDGSVEIIACATGPGGFVQTMEFLITATPLEDGGSQVRLEVGEFLYQKNMGFKPTINAKKVMDKFSALFRPGLTSVS